MCGITFVFRKYQVKDVFVSTVSHRGPDAHKQVTRECGLFAFDRLAINDMSEEGNQPFEDANGILICNGEIYNHHNLRAMTKIETVSESDCEVLHKLLGTMESPEEITRLLDAEFAFVYYSHVTKHLTVARDPFGVRPLYVAYDAKNAVVGFSSEAKGLSGVPAAVRFKQFPPGQIWTFHHQGELSQKSFFEIAPRSFFLKTPFEQHVHMIRSLLIEAVDKRIRNTERPVAFFLSGGLDSSIIAAIGASLTADKPITTYSVGIGEASPDLMHARLMAKHLGSDHHEITFDPREAQAYVRKVICKIESYDCTTIRASVPMYMLAEYIAHHSDDRVVLSGEGADELFGGYLYFHHAPSDQDFHDETVRLLRGIHQFDGLRADRCTAAHGLELRVPFLDLALVEYVLNVDPSMKRGAIEKRLLREAFAHLLPDAIYRRQKNGMSDAVGYSWVDHLRANAVPTAENDYIRNPPLTPEERCYREIFHEFYEDADCSHDTIWRPRWVEETDPSARKLNVFKTDS